MTPLRCFLLLLGGATVTVMVALACALSSRFIVSSQRVLITTDEWPRQVPAQWPQEDILLTTERAFGLTFIKSRLLVARTQEPANVLATYLELIRTADFGDPEKKTNTVGAATELLRSLQDRDERPLERRADAVLRFVREHSTTLDEETRSRINIALIPLTDLYSMYSLHVIEAGWPFRSLEAEARSAVSLEPEGRHATRLGLMRSGFRMPSGPWVPIKPMWPGFLFSTILFALLLWPITLAPRAMLHLLRRHSGQCPECGAPIGVEAECRQCGQDLSDFWRG